MKPTAKLRFVERYVYEPEHGDDGIKRVLILQQWWVIQVIHDEEIGEWQDVPLENEA
jgi:hypothetical protein